MSNPQWSIRLNQTKIDKLNQIINTTYSGDRQKFIDDVFNKLVDNKYPEIHNLVSSIMRFNEAQHTNTDRVVITYRLLYSLLENTRQVAILNYLESNSVLIETHHKKWDCLTLIKRLTLITDLSTKRQVIRIIMNWLSKLRWINLD